MIVVLVMDVQQIIFSLNLYGTKINFKGYNRLSLIQSDRGRCHIKKKV